MLYITSGILLGYLEYHLQQYIYVFRKDSHRINAQFCLTLHNSLDCGNTCKMLGLDFSLVTVREILIFQFTILW